MGPEEQALAFGEVVRVMGAGESFGELALLQSDCKRTATVIADLPQEHPAGQKPVALLKITRACYDATVSNLEFLEFLYGMGCVAGIGFGV